MSNRFAKNLFLALALLCILSIFTGTDSIWAAEGIAAFKAVSGTVDVLRGGKLPAVVVKVGDSLSEGDFIRTRSGSFAEIQFRDGTVLKVAQRSRIDIAAYFSGQQKNGANVRLPRGKVEAIVDPARVKEAGKGRRFEVHTPNAVAGVRGTDFIVSHERNLTGVFVRHGSVYTYNRRMPDRIVTVNAGNITTVTPGAPPQTPRQALPSETQRMEKGMTAPKSGNGGQSDGQNGSHTGQTGSQTSSQADNQSSGQTDSQTGSQTASTATIGTQTPQTVDSASNGGTTMADPLPLITTTFAAQTTSADTTVSKTTTVISADPTAGLGPVITAVPATILPPPTPPPVVSPLPTTTNINVIVNIPPTPPPIVPPPSTNVNVNVNF